MAVDKNHRGMGAALLRNALLLVISSAGACCFPRHCRWGGWWKRQEVLWTFRIFPNKRTGHETYSFYRRYSKIIRGSLSWQRLLLANCFMSFGMADSFNYFSFSTFGYLKNRENKSVSSKQQPALEPLSYFRSALICILSTHWKRSRKTHW